MKLRNDNKTMNFRSPVNGVLTEVELGRITAFIKNGKRYPIPKGKSILQVFKQVDKIKTKKK